MKQALDILSTYFGHRQFRPAQEEVVSHVLQKNNVLALLPTGGGKSICFQVPALAQEGICIVISPLIALMQDQVSNLLSKGIKAMVINSGIPYSELDTLLDNCIYGNYKFLYLSPERLQQEIVLNRIERMNVNLIAVDEAHCISQWGQDFRPMYQKIPVLKSIQPNATWMALTATATEKVTQDILTLLEMDQPKVVKKSFARSNIAFLIDKREDKAYHLEQFFKKNQGSSIVYVRSRMESVRLSQYLNQKGLSSSAYHGGITTNEKTLRLKQWLNDHIQIMVATNAFGMGIDKSNVRSVVHYQLPESMESYFQEAGRAGRDGQPAKAVILFNNTDSDRVRHQFLDVLPDVDFVKKTYRKLQQYFGIAYGEGENTTHDFNFQDFCIRYELNARKVHHTLQLLDRVSILKLSQQYRKKTEVQFLVSSAQVLFFWEQNRKFEQLIKILLRTYPGIFDQKTSINLSLIQKKTTLSEEQLLRQIEELKHAEVLDFTMEKNDASITFRVPREDDRSINPITKYIKQQYRHKEAQVGSILNYITNNKVCKSVQLLSYFDEKNLSDCGICSVCLQKKKKAPQDQKAIKEAIIQLLKETDLPSREIVSRLNYSEEDILHTLRVLLEYDHIQLSYTNTYSIK